jgi:sugar (pentulose or hexulose) kinase
MAREQRLSGSAIVVLDCGKTQSKLTLWGAGGVLVERRTRRNERTVSGPYPALDVVGIETWLAATLAEFANLASICAIIPVGHGAAAAVIRDGVLACLPMDYEHEMPPDKAEAYDSLRDPFVDTGSPRLPDGLNLGAQLFHLGTLLPGLFGPGTRILMWPQYWAWLLSGVAASEVTSLGCHTDLWHPATGTPSRLARQQGWGACMPPLRRAGDSLGVITPAWAARTGLAADTKICCGMHDSNAALLAARGFPEIAGAEATVISTGTWFIAMRSPRAALEFAALPEARDCLVNVDAFGQPVPSSRFMAGREIESLIGFDTRQVDIVPDQPNLLAAVPGVVAGGTLLLPGFAPGTGPFPDRTGRWINKPVDAFACRAAVCLYAALVTDVSLGLIGAQGTILVEGRFAAAEVFVRALATLRPDCRVFVAQAHNDVSFGALRLIHPELVPTDPLATVPKLQVDLAAYKQEWSLLANATETAG